jgi:hypothetical protein
VERNIQFIVNGIVIYNKQLKTKDGIVYVNESLYEKMKSYRKVYIVQTTYIVRRCTPKSSVMENMLCGSMSITPLSDILSLPCHTTLPTSRFSFPNGTPLSLRPCGSLGHDSEHPQMISPEDIRSGNFLLHRHTIHLVSSLLVVAITIIIPL